MLESAGQVFYHCCRGNLHRNSHKAHSEYTVKEQPITQPASSVPQKNREQAPFPHL
jgi:hypothetical protein